MNGTNRLVLALVASLFASAPAFAVEGAKSSPSPFGGNGHNVSFDGRLYLVAQGNGWNAQVFRPENVAFDGGGFPNMNSGAFTSPYALGASANGENAVAICEPDPDSTPFRCDLSGNSDPAGNYDCYDLWLFDSNATLQGAALQLQRRRLKVWVRDPGTASAAIEKHQFLSGLEPLTPVLRGLEPTMTRDGKLLVWQGHPDNDGDIDILMYSVNANPCATSGWTAPKVITAMASDPLVNTTYPIAEKPLKDSLGTVFASGQLFHGAYPWVFPDGSAISFTAAGMPCQGGIENNPPGCGPRRNAFSVIGYPTNWAVGHVDGGVNPSREDVVRLFFSSPGPKTFTNIPVTQGQDVWPFFGSNTSNYTEVKFDDGLDGRYSGVWHMNEAVSTEGKLVLTQTPDTGGYFHTGTLLGAAYLPAANNGVDGKAVILDGVSGRVVVNDSPALTPLYALTVEMRIRPASDPNCDANNNWRMLLGKPDLGGSYSLVFEEGGVLQARIRAGGVEHSVWSGAALPIGQWSTIAFTYLSTTGESAFFVNGVETNRVPGTPGLIDDNVSSLFIGGPGVAAACPDGAGAFHGEIDEVRISNIVRYPEEISGEPTPTPEGTPTPGPGGDDDDDDDDDGVGPGSNAGGGKAGGCSVASATPAAPTAAFALLALAAVLASRRRPKY